MKINTRKLEIEMARRCIDEHELCEKSGISRATFSQVKRGLRNPRPSTLGRIAIALEVDVTDLLLEEGVTA